MIKTNKILNLRRLDFKNKCIVVLYLLKIVLKIKPSQKELDVYIYYNYLVLANGYLISEMRDFFITDFRNNFSKAIKLRKKPSSDMDVFRQIYCFEEYLPVATLYKNNFTDSFDYKMNIIDAGSNIGLTSLFFLEHFNKPNIICIEPEQENFKVLDFNLASNYAKIVKVNGAIWSHDSKIKILKDFRGGLDWSFRVEEATESDAIQGFSLNNLVKTHNLEYIDILKIDIEGAEKQVFTSKSSNLDFLNITKCIAIEIHDEFNCREDIYKILTDYGYTFITRGELTIGINTLLI